jgi:integrase
LRLPDLEHAKAAVLNSLTSVDAQRVIVTPSMNSLTGIVRNLAWLSTELQCCAIGLISNPVNLHLAPSIYVLGGVHLLAYEAADLAAGIRRVKGVKKLGVRVGNWLTAEQSQALWQAPDHQRLKGKHARALLALLLACGLRRHEAVALRLDHLQQREEHWAIVDLVGKRGQVRTVPVPDWMKTELDDWLAAAEIDRGRLFRRVNKVGRTWGDGMTVKAVWHLVKEIRGEGGATRSATLCSALPYFGRRVGADPIPPGQVSVQTTE